LGSFCALLISFPFKTLKNIPNVLKMLLSSPGNERAELVSLFAELSRKARKDGLLALEDELEKIDNPFLVSGLQLVIDGVEPDSIRDILELKAETIERRHATGQAVFLKWGELAPAFGMIGTLIGLIIMLSQLDDPSSIGSGMATALLTTFYGSLMANLVFIPIASNLKVQTEEELFTAQMIIEGILEIQAGTNPRLLEEKLLLYLTPKEKNNTKNKSNKDLENGKSNEAINNG
jgi:chemotaxis protein MotA